MFKNMTIKIKEINDSEYYYYIYYENGQKRDMYCGSVNNPKAKKKVTELEINHLKEQKIILSKKIKKLGNSLKKK